MLYLQYLFIRKIELPHYYASLKLLKRKGIDVFADTKSNSKTSETPSISVHLYVCKKIYHATARQQFIMILVSYQFFFSLEIRGKYYFRTKASPSCFRSSATLLVNTSPPKPLDIATSNFANTSVTWCRGHWATFCMILIPRSTLNCAGA